MTLSVSSKDPYVVRAQTINQAKALGYCDDTHGHTYLAWPFVLEVTKDIKEYEVDEVAEPEQKVTQHVHYGKAQLEVANSLKNALIFLINTFSLDAFWRWSSSNEI